MLISFQGLSSKRFLYSVTHKFELGRCIELCLCVCVCVCVCTYMYVFMEMLLFVTVQGFSRQEYWSGLPFPSPGDLPNPGIEPRSPAL